MHITEMDREQLTAHLYELMAEEVRLLEILTKVDDSDAFLQLEDVMARMDDVEELLDGGKL